jgi:hypothetical protein
MRAADLYTMRRREMGESFENAGFSPVKTRYPAWCKKEQELARVVFFFAHPKYPFDAFNGGSFGGGICLRPFPVRNVERIDYDSLQCIAEPKFFESLCGVQRQVVSKLLAKTPASEDEEFMARNNRSHWEWLLKEPMRPKSEEYLKYTDDEDLHAWFQLLSSSVGVLAKHQPLPQSYED